MGQYEPRVSLPMTSLEDPYAGKVTLPLDQAITASAPQASFAVCEDPYAGVQAPIGAAPPNTEATAGERHPESCAPDPSASVSATAPGSVIYYSGVAPGWCFHLGGAVYQVVRVLRDVEPFVVEYEATVVRTCWGRDCMDHGPAPLVTGPLP